MRAAGWLLHRLTGLFLVLGLIVHFSKMHYGLSAPYGTPFKMIFLSSVIYHGFYGSWGLAVEYIGPTRLLRACQIFILLSASFLTIVGVYIITG